MDEEGAEFFCAFLCQHDVLNQHGEHVSHIYRIDRTPSCYLPPEVVSSLSIHSISPTLYYISFHIFPTISCSSSLTLTLSVVDLHESVGVGGYKEKGVWMGHGKGKNYCVLVSRCCGDWRAGREAAKQSQISDYTLEKQAQKPTTHD